jgi:hypothetical protein
VENQKSKRASGKTRLGSLLRTRIPIHFYLVFTRSPVRLWICQPTGAKLLRTVIPYCRVSHQRWRSTAHGAQITRCRFFRAHAIIELALTTATELPPMPLRKLRPSRCPCTGASVLHRPYPVRRQAGRSSGTGADQVRNRCQPQDSEDARRNDTARPAFARGVIRARGHRSTMIHSTRLQDRAVMRNGFAVGAERENAGSRRIRPEASRALARGHAQDLRQSKSIEAGKTGKSRVRSQTY